MLCGTNNAAFAAEKYENADLLCVLCDVQKCECESVWPAAAV